MLYNTCSIRDKAEQKVFHRLQQFKTREPPRARFRSPRLRGAAGGRAIFETRSAREPGGGSASYTKLPEC